MECKNCKNRLGTDYSFCPTCGAKIIHNRLSFHNLRADIIESFFNIDNTLLKTFLHLFSKPEVIIGGYINGIRKKYMNPISYFALSIVITGILFWVLKEGYGIKLIDTVNQEGATPMPDMDFIMDYQGLMTYFLFPIYTLMTYLLFIDKRVFNFTEHLVITAYVTTQFSIVQFLIAIPLFGLFDFNYGYFNYIYIIMIIVYWMYVLKRMHKISILSSIFRGLLFFLMFIIVMMVLGALLISFLFLTGAMNLEDFRPQ
ncbi:MAG: hypothetical protein COA50_11870 [Flavobacteriaceae bacterium]|nr:MAG: hypothetical protein COA50_11870 [Flavobacteriaceae bacterium]